MLYICSIKWSNMINENKLILYKDEEGKLSVSTRFADEDVWLTQALKRLSGSSKSIVSVRCGCWRATSIRR